MNWKFPSNFLRGSQDQNGSPTSQEIPAQSWYPPAVADSSSRPSTLGNSPGTSFHQGANGQPPPVVGQPSPSEAAGIIARLKDKSVDELRKLLSDKETYHAFFLSLDQVKIQNNLRHELRKETLQLARENLEKEPRILELRNQCQIIRTTELAAAQEKLYELEKQKDDMMKSYSLPSLLQKLHDEMERVEEESEELHRQLLRKEVDLAAFVQKYKKLRTVYHRRALLHLAAKTSAAVY